MDFPQGVLAIRATNSSMTEQERILLKMVLRLWVGIRIISRSEHICGDETLGISTDMLDESSPMYGQIVIPPVISAQFDSILMESILPSLRTMILDQLAKMFMTYAKKHGLQTRYADPDVIKRIHLGAKVLLAHYHYCCKGFQPFALDWDASETTSMAELDSDQVKFV
ncbi:hypothetical protein IFR04_005582 [Cadophora malorum]|uniref:Uncharacterized protein n=1 Tax=Cadophora malorum TaxID=108018 RepID=A0A8H7TL86_9HELO|nr:hypothetical protein IFR04_005582 [Cadophora malorum]